MNNNESPMLAQDTNGLSDISTQNPHHRRTQSEILSRDILHEKLTFGPSLSDENEEGEEEDLFSLFIDVEKIDQSYDTSPDSQPKTTPQIDLFKPVEETLTLPLTGLVSSPLMENGSSKEKSGVHLSKEDQDPSRENGSTKENGALAFKEKEPLNGKGTTHALPLKGPMLDPIEEKYPIEEKDQIEEKDPIRDERKGKAPVSAGPRHRHTQSLDETNGSGLVGLGFDAGLVSAKLMDAGLSASDAKKAMANARIAELAITDPRKAKRIWANRQSAARSKERKVKYINQLERRVDSLRNESTTLSAQLAFLQRDTGGLTMENNELRLRVQAMEQQVDLQDSLNEALRTEVQRLKIATGQVPANFNTNPQFSAPAQNPNFVSNNNINPSQNPSFSNNNINPSQNPTFFNNNNINSSCSSPLPMNPPNPNFFKNNNNINPSCTSSLQMSPHQLTNQQIASFRFLDQHQHIQAPAPVQAMGMMQPQAQVTTAQNGGGSEGSYGHSYYN